MAEPIDPHIAEQLRQVVKMVGKTRAIEYIARLRVYPDRRLPHTYLLHCEGDGNGIPDAEVQGTLNVARAAAHELAREHNCPVTVVRPSNLAKILYRADDWRKSDQGQANNNIRKKGQV